jgi:hypothetical protein
MKIKILSFLSIIPLSLLALGQDKDNTPEPREVSRKSISLVECDVNQGTLVLTIDGKKMRYLPAQPPLPGMNRARPESPQPPVFDLRQHRLFECLALQKAISSIEPSTITRLVLVTSPSNAEQGVPPNDR